MDQATILLTKQKVDSLIDNKQLKKAFSQLKEFTKPLREWQYEQKLEELGTSYQYMLSYMGNGMVDPERDKLYRKIVSDIYSLNDRVADKWLQKDTSSLFYSNRRLFLSRSDAMKETYLQLEKAVRNLSLAELIEDNENDQKKHLFLEQIVEKESSDLFFIIWSNLFPTNEEKETLKEIFTSTNLPTPIQAMLVSALTLNILHCYDDFKLSLLIDIAYNEELQIRQRALVGLMLVVAHYEKRVLLSELIQSKLSMLFDDESHIKELRVIQMQFIRSRETERITKKLNEEILPEMMKMGNSLSTKIKTDDLLNESGEPDLNPEWEDYLNKSGIGDKLKEITELQMEGADVLMSAFSNLKQFPFFQNLANWFSPFYVGNSALYSSNETAPQNRSFIEFIDKSFFLCNSDKYSFCLSLMQMPPAQRKMMAEQFEAQNDQIKEFQEAQEQELMQKKNESVSNLYIQDLYRFFKLHPQRAEFCDPFNSNLNFFHNSLLKKYFNDTETLKVLGELFFKKSFYQDALEVFKFLAEREQANHDIYQKIGYCLQELGNYQEAVAYYRQADIIHPDSTWTLRRLGACYRTLRQPEKAIEYYERYNTLKPGNLTIELNIGHCYLEMKKIDEALQHYFKVDYLEPNQMKAWRPIAWCSFLIGKYEQANRYYEKILSDSNSSALDYINAGHTAWAMNNLPQAIAYYKNAIQLSNKDKSLFEKTISQDKEDLLHAGITETDFYLMMDEVNYDSEK